MWGPQLGALAHRADVITACACIFQCDHGMHSVLDLLVVWIVYTESSADSLHRV